MAAFLQDHPANRKTSHCNAVYHRLPSWNEYLLASVIINDKAMKTVPVGIMTFVGEHGTDYGYLCAGVLVSVIPVMVVYLIFQRYFVEGIATSGLKG